MATDISDAGRSGGKGNGTAAVDGVPQPQAPDFGLTKFLDPLPVPPVLRPHSWWHRDEITITTARVDVRLHSELPPTTVWGYDGHFPGPTIDVHRDRVLRISWTNGINGPFPLVAVQADLALAPGATNLPGYRSPDGTLPAGVSIIDGVAELPPWNVVHLHGAATDGGADGWAHNGVLKGHSQLTEYQNRQRSATLWYHDNAMAITRLNVHTGLAGMYLVRDEAEAELGLPSDEYEIPLIICDRNLDVNVATGKLTGQLLYKVPVVPATGATVPFTGPFTLVNGVIWPHLAVAPRWYRFRVCNAANARFFTLNLVDGQDRRINHNAAVRQIGTDGGLLPEPIPLPDPGLTLAPAERADLLIDFGRLRGRSVVLTNTGTDTGPPPEPDVMEFRVRDRDVPDRFVLPSTISKSYYRLRYGVTLPDDHAHVWAALVPPGTAGDGHPQLWELAEITDPARIPGPLPAEGIIQLTDPDSGAVRTFQRVARVFDDATNIFLDHGGWAVWHLIHLGGPAHPIHIHLTQFQALARDRLEIGNFNTAVGGTSAALPAPTPGTLDANETGWKDVIRVHAGDWVTVAGQFAHGTGSFVYHCHILDHEDDGMMRPFVVQPAEVNRLMG